jgi:hypothetical protein
MARQFNRKQIRALIKESLYQMVYDMPSDMYDEEMADEEMRGDSWADYETDDDIPFSAADVAQLMRRGDD